MEAASSFETSLTTNIVQPRIPVFRTNLLRSQSTEDAVNACLTQRLATTYETDYTVSQTPDATTLKQDIHGGSRFLPNAGNRLHHTWPQPRRPQSKQKQILRATDTSHICSLTFRCIQWNNITGVPEVRHTISLPLQNLHWYRL
jgi:hypothetical protein